MKLVPEYLFLVTFIPHLVKQRVLIISSCFSIMRRWENHLWLHMVTSLKCLLRLVVESEHPCQPAEPKICIKKDDTLIQPVASIYNSTHHHPSFDSPNY